MRNVLIILAMIWAWVLIPPALRQARGKGGEQCAMPTEPTEPTERPLRIRNRTFRQVVAYLGLVDDPRYDGGVLEPSAVLEAGPAEAGARVAAVAVAASH